jgi:hypothetical protein
MNSLCLSIDLTSAEWAAWVQAIGTIIAVAATASIAVWQSRRQHQSALALHKEEQRHARLEQAKTLLTLCQNCTKAAKHFAAQMHDRESVYLIATKETYFDFGELHALQNATTNIPLYSLPSTLLTNAMILGATFRQLKQTIDIALEQYRSMDAEQYQKLFDTLDEINESLELTCLDIQSAVENLKKEG